ncbi:alpha/beta family hydrolase [Pseudokineococcus basanitobsidens]|uniref:Alpha/beta family hydrolase n=1 Tax=Pseudokineococcus basanitobsidens TaxID=1926649 RepID=A0ABU8RJB0_9ACTN
MPTDAAAPLPGAAASVVEVATVEGPALAVVHVPGGRRGGLLVLGHGAGGRAGARTPDLLAVAQEALLGGWGVVLVDQPWVVAGRGIAVAPARLDTAWVAVVEHLRTTDLLVTGEGPLVLGGRSAGARVACRTAGALGADGVLALAFPLHPPERPDRSRAAELPQDVVTLVVQGERDRFGSPADVAAVAGPRTEVVGVPGDHALRRDRGALREAVRPWLGRLAGDRADEGEGRRESSR